MNISNVKYATNFVTAVISVIFWADACTTRVRIHCCKWPNYDFCISRGGV